MEDRMLCYCLLKRASDIAAAWKESGSKDVRSFMETSKLGTVCTSCRGELYQLVEQIARGEVMPPVRADAPKMSSARRPQLSRWKRTKRWVKQLLKKREGMRQLEFHALACAGEGWQSSLLLSNFAHPDFPGRAVPLVAHVALYGMDGASLGEEELPISVDGVRTVDVGRRLGLASDEKRRFGLVHVRFFPPSKREGRRWRVGTNRPYVTWQKDGRPLTVHEKSVQFERWCVLPGVVALPGFEMELCFANLGEQAGTISFRLKAGEKEREEVVEVGPHASARWVVPFQIEGAWLTQVEAYSTIALTGYQLVRNVRSGLFAIQHLVKEGS